MLNDQNRNNAFKKAIRCWIQKGKQSVIDIGSGTGLLSLYAANVPNIHSVYAVEFCETMCKISEKAFAMNHPRRVKLVTKHSKYLEMGEDIPQKASLIVSETLDCGAFGEGILETLIHAKENLLASNGKIVPWKIRIHIAGYNSETLSANKFILNDTILDNIHFGNNKLIAKNDEPYDAEYVDKITDFKLVTNVEMNALEVDFNDLGSMRKHFEGIINTQIELRVNVPSDDLLDGFATWFTLYLNECDENNVINTGPESNSCWPQALFKMRHRVPVNKDDILKISMSCKDGVLAVNHELDAAPEKTDIEVEPSVLQFINDYEYLRELKSAVENHHDGFIEKCLDFTPFPCVGLSLLKAAKVHKLYCHKKDEELIKLIAKANMISGSKIEYLEDPIFGLPLQFNVILLHPFHSLGDLDNQIIVDYQKYSQKLLNRHSLLVPQKISVFGELIYSSFLVNSSRVDNAELKQMGIENLINEFRTEVHLDLDNSVEHEKLGLPFKLSDVYFDGGFHESIVDSPLYDLKLPIQGILLHHKIKFTECSNDEFSTNRESTISCFRRCAQILVHESNCEVKKVSVIYQQNTGIVRCDVVR